MQVAYVNTTCHCNEQGFEAFVWDDTRGALRPALPDEDPVLQIRCSTCGGSRQVRAAVMLDHQPVEPLTDNEMDELLSELDSVREQVAHEELTRPYVWPSLLQRLDQLSAVEELQHFEETIDMLERTGVLVMPGLLKQREELRATVRGLLPVAA